MSSVPKRIAWIAPLLIAVATPLVFFPAAEDAYRLPQMLVLAFAAPLLCLQWILAGRPDLQLRDVAVLAFFVWRFFTHVAAGSPDPLWLSEQSLYLFLYFWAASHFTDFNAAVRFRGWLLIGAGLAAAWGMLQVFGLDPFSERAAATGFSHRAYATLGNPDFWAGYLVALLPLGLVPLLDKRAPLHKWALVLPGFLLLSLILSQTRGAWIAFVCSGLFLVIKWKERIAFKRVALGMGLGLVALVLTSFPNPLNPSALKSFERLTSSFQLNNQGATGRFFMWTAAVRVAADNPVIGVGGGNFTHAYLLKQGEMLHEAAYKNEPYRFTNDAHNDWLQLAAESGLLALLMFCGLVGFTLKRLLARGETMDMALACGLVAWSVHACFNFPAAIVPSAALLWILLGWSSARGERQLVMKKFRLSFFRLGLPLLMLLPLYIVSRSLWSSLLLNRGISLEMAGNREGAVVMLKESIRTRSEYRNQMRLGAIYDKDGRIEQASEAFQQAVVHLPGSADAWANLGLVKGKLGKLQESEAALIRSLALNPKSLPAWSNLGKLRYESKNIAGALEAYQSGVNLEPAWAQGLASLAFLHWKSGEKEKAKNYAEKALTHQSNLPLAQQVLKEISVQP